MLLVLVLASLALPLIGGVIALPLNRFPRASSAVASASLVIGCGFGLVVTVPALLSGTSSAVRWPWHVPYGEFHLAVDPLSSLFLTVIFGLSMVCAVYGVPYLKHYSGRKALGPVWFFFNLLVVSMVLVVLARNGILFLVAWELMAIASFFLVTFEHEKPEVRSAGLIYLIATHLGTAFLLAMFALLGKETGSLEFDRFSQVGALAPGAASAVFILAIIGFGAKAGFVPMHVWLPEAHPAAPSHVSALMSGVMIKTGIYGILRVLTFMDAPPAWWGILLIGIGLTSGIMGVLFALAQHDLKRLLAYSSVENIGIILLGLGTGVLGLSQGMSSVALLGFAGAALHVLNHTAFKGLLFLAAGSVFHATGRRDMDRQGGLLKRMPLTGSTFLVGAAAISGLPPFNGFVSEFLIFLGALNGVGGSDVPGSVSLVAVVGGLGLIGGLAIACFTKAFGVVFLGEPRTRSAATAREGGLDSGIPMVTLAAVCVLIGVLPVMAIYLVLPVASQISGMPLEAARLQLTGASSPLALISLTALIVVGLAVILLVARLALLAGREIGSTVTWDCGFERPSPRMQYTSSSFTQPLLLIFRQLLGTRIRLHSVEGYFPGRASFHSHTPDIFTDRIYLPTAAWIERMSGRLRWLQQGRVQIYLLYIFAALVILMVWKFGF